MAVNEIKDYSAVSAAAAADKLIVQQAADNVTRYITPTQIIGVFKSQASGIAALSATSKVSQQPESISDHLDDTAGGTNSATTKAATSNVVYDHGVATTGVHGAGASTLCTTAVADSKDVTAIATHAAEADPHTGYRLESADHTHLTTGAQGGVLNLFGAWDTTKTHDISYLAAADGLVCVAAAATTVDWKAVVGYSDSSNPPTTLRGKGQTEGASSMLHSFMFLVRKGDYWKVTSSNGTMASSTIFWLPIGG